DEAGEQREDRDRCREGGGAADVIGACAPEQRAEERADQAYGRQQPRLRLVEPEFARDRWQRHAEQREVAGVEHHAEEAEGEEIFVPARERQTIETADEFGGFAVDG